MAIPRTFDTKKFAELFYDKQLSYKDISKILNVPTATLTDYRWRNNLPTRGWANNKHPWIGRSHTQDSIDKMKSSITDEMREFRRKVALKRISKNNSTVFTSKSEKLLLDTIENIYAIKIHRAVPYYTHKFGCVYDGKYKNWIIEVDSDYWHSSDRERRNDELKTHYALENGYNILRIKVNRVEEVNDIILGNFSELDKIFGDYGATS